MGERWYTGVLSDENDWSSTRTVQLQQKPQPQQQRQTLDRIKQIEETCLAVAATIISNRLILLRHNECLGHNGETKKETLEEQQSAPLLEEKVLAPLDDAVSATITTKSPAHVLAQGRFQDLTMTREGAQVLESLFLDETLQNVTDDITHGTIYVLQSLCIMGMLVGVKGTPEQEQRRVQHLREVDDDTNNNEVDAVNGRRDDSKNRKKSLQDMTIGNLKYFSDQTAGTQLLAQLSLKRTTQGAMDLLISLGAWTKHEDLPLLRSGFPILFTDEQLQAAASAARDTVDVDEVLGIRMDLTHHKVYTIDSESASEVDDGLSVEELQDGRLKFWIHIADADRWAPRDSAVFQMAKSRTTTHYLPTGPIPMFPPKYVAMDALVSQRRLCMHCPCVSLALPSDSRNLCTDLQS